MRRFSLGHPAPGHYPNVGRVSRGMTPVAPSRPVYATTLSCSCGERFGVVSSYAPTRGGRPYANDAYRAHVAALTERGEL